MEEELFSDQRGDADAVNSAINNRLEYLANAPKRDLGNAIRNLLSDYKPLEGQALLDKIRTTSEYQNYCNSMKDGGEKVGELSDAQIQEFIDEENRMAENIQRAKDSGEY